MESGPRVGTRTEEAEEDRCEGEDGKVPENLTFDADNNVLVANEKDDTLRILLV